MKPGVRRRIPAARIIAPWPSSRPGTAPRSTAMRSSLRTLKPCYRSRTVPIIAVTKTSARVQRSPIRPPITTNAAISRIGTRRSAKGISENGMATPMSGPNPGIAFSYGYAAWRLHALALILCSQVLYQEQAVQPWRTGMSEIFDTTTLVTIAVAIFILLRLRSVLGKRTGHQSPPERREVERMANDVRKTAARAGADATDNVISLPGRSRADDNGDGGNEAFAAINTYAKPGTRLNRGLRQLAEKDPGFNPEGFLAGARMAYEMIVTAFADGDRKALRNLLSREVYEGFASAIAEREKRGESVRFTFVGIEKADIVQAGLNDNDAHVTVRFVSQIVSATQNAKGEVIDGDPDQVAEVDDIWTFARDIGSRDPNWKLVATESEG